VAKNLCLLPASKNFLLKKVLRMSLSAASLAEMQGKIRETDPAAEAVRCLMLFVLLVVNRARFLFSREMIAQYIAAIALKDGDNF
jgi:hypothetical protein